MRAIVFAIPAKRVGPIRKLGTMVLCIVKEKFDET